MRAQTQLDFAVGVGVFLVVTAFVLSFVPGMLEPFESGNQEETVAANRVADQLVGGMLGSPDEPYVLDRECTIVFFEVADDNVDGNGDGFNEPYSDAETYDVDNCNFDDDPVVERVGLDTNPSLNVRIRLVRNLTTSDRAVDPGIGLTPDPGPDDTLCLDTNNPRIVEAGYPRVDDDDDSGGSEDWEVQCDLTGGDDDVLFEIGDDPQDLRSVVVARRTVSVEGGFADNTSDASLIVEVW
jgi:hypothetical protein